MAIILRDGGALFVDGRYLVQAEEDCRGSGLAICHTAEKLQPNREWLLANVRMGMRLAIDPSLHASHGYGQWRRLSRELEFELVPLETNPVDALWTDRPERAGSLVDYPVAFAGEVFEVKCRRVAEALKHAGHAALLIADPEDVCWLLNVRGSDDMVRTKVGEWHVVPASASRAIVSADGQVHWFVERDRLSPDLLARPGIVIEAPEAIGPWLRQMASTGKVAMDLSATPAALADVVRQHQDPVDDRSVAVARWRKHANEVDAARSAHLIDAAAVTRLMAWILRTLPERDLTELDVAEQLETFRAAHPDYKGPSMPAMAASGRSAAQPHYVPSARSNRSLRDHPIFSLDSGGQYYGGSTDNTICLAVGAAEARHVLAHTLVLQGLIGLSDAQFPQGTTGVHLDVLARLPLWREGFDYSTGTGHGVGNYLNIHEGPRIGREWNSRGATPLEPGMIISNEPGYYAAGDFGLRLETHMVVVEADRPGFFRFDTISRFPIDPALIDFARLSTFERSWLRDYHRRVVEALVPLLDDESAAWLRAIAAIYEALGPGVSESAAGSGCPAN